MEQLCPEGARQEPTGNRLSNTNPRDLDNDVRNRRFRDFAVVIPEAYVVRVVFAGTLVNGSMGRLVEQEHVVPADGMRREAQPHSRRGDTKGCALHVWSTRRREAKADAKRSSPERSRGDHRASQRLPDRPFVVVKLEVLGGVAHPVQMPVEEIKAFGRRPA